MQAFFTEATYATEGLKQTVSSVFRRIAGDQTVPSIQRMETAFGGGKTHSLIACVHIANRGTELKDVTKDILEPQYLPVPHSVTVVGIAGDEIPVNKIKGDRRKLANGRLRQTVLFTRFFDTLTSIRKYLGMLDSSLRIGIYAGGNRAVWYDTQRCKDCATTHEESQFGGKAVDLLFVTSESAGKVHTTVYGILLNCVIEEARREAANLRAKNSDKLTAELIRRLERR